MSIDLLITDLLMPRIDGLQLIREAKALKDDIGILVLSCLDDFAYVKDAMKLGASDYILKPTMEPEQLVGILQGMKTALLEKREGVSRMNAWKQQAEQSKAFQLSAQIRSSIINGSFDAELEEALFLDGEIFTVMVYWTSSHKLSVSGWNFKGCAASVRWQDHALLLLYRCENMTSQLDSHQIRHAKAIEIQQKLVEESVNMDLKWMIGMGVIIHKLSELSQSIGQHQRQMQWGFYANTDQTIVWDEGRLGTDEAALPYELRNDMMRSIVNKNGESMEYQAELLVQWMLQHKPNVAKLQVYVFELLGLAAGYAREQGYVELDEYEQHYVSMEAVQSCFNAEQLKKWLINAIHELWQRRYGSVTYSVSTNPFIRKAIQYMKGNYNRNIGTTDIADHVRLSRSYLSDLYSKEMGESLVESLTRIRIEEAKKKLVTDQMHIYEVAEAVGFSDAKSFARTFRKIVGCSPKEYESKAR